MGLHLKSAKQYPFGDLSPYFGNTFSCFTATADDAAVFGKNITAVSENIQQAVNDESTADPNLKDKSDKKDEKKQAMGETNKSDNNAVADTNNNQPVKGSTRNTNDKSKKNKRFKFKNNNNEIPPGESEQELTCGIDPEDEVRVRGVCTLRLLRRHRWGVDPARFYKTTHLTVDALKLPKEGTTKRKTAQCKCPYSPCLCRRAALRPWKWIPFALRMVWARALCALCQRLLHPAAPPPATRFAAHLAAADAARSVLMERNAKYARQSSAADPVFCLATQIPYFECDRGPNFAYREMMRRLRETRDRQLGQYEEEPITRECRIIKGREMCDVGTQVAAQADGSLWRGAGRVMFGRLPHDTLCHAYAGAKLQLEREPPPPSDTIVQACVIKPIKNAVSKTKTQITDVIEKVLRDPVINNDDELWHLHVKPITVRSTRARSRRTYRRPRRGPLPAAPTTPDGRDTNGGDAAAPNVTSSSVSSQKPAEIGDTQSKSNTKTLAIDSKEASTASNKSDQQAQGSKPSTASPGTQPTADANKNSSSAAASESTNSNKDQRNAAKEDKPKVIAHVSVMVSNGCTNDGATLTEDVSKNTITGRKHSDAEDTRTDFKFASSLDYELATSARALLTMCSSASDTNSYPVSVQTSSSESSSCKSVESVSVKRADDQQCIAPDGGPAAAGAHVQHVSMHPVAAAHAYGSLLCARVARHAMMTPRQRYLAATGGGGGSGCGGGTRC